MGSARAVLPRCEDSPSGDPTGMFGLLSSWQCPRACLPGRAGPAVGERHRQALHGPAAGKGCTGNAAPEPHFSGSGQKPSMLLDRGPKGLSARKHVI